MPYYDNPYFASPPNSTHLSHNGPVYYNPVNNYHQQVDATGASHNTHLMSNPGVIDSYSNVPQAHASNYTQQLAQNSQPTSKSPTYHDDPSMSAASHYPSQINSPPLPSSSSPSVAAASPPYYPMQYNYHQQQMSAPSMQVAHHYSDQPVLHQSQINPPSAAVHNINGNNNNNNGHFNNYYPQQHQQFASMPAHPPGHVNSPQSRYPVNYVHPIAPSNGNAATINRKYDSGSPVSLPSTHTAINLTKALSPGHPASTSPSTTPKPIELEMSLEDIFRLAQISSMFSNMSFISMDPIASPSDAKISMSGSNDPKMIAPIKLPMPSEDGKSDGRKYFIDSLLDRRLTISNNSFSLLSHLLRRYFRPL